MSILKNMNRVYWIAVLVVFVVGFAGCESDDHDGVSEIGITLTKSTVGQRILPSLWILPVTVPGI